MDVLARLAADDRVINPGRAVDEVQRRVEALLGEPHLGRVRPGDFRTFRISLDGMAPNTLSTRLKDLEASGLVVRRTYSDHPPRLEYQLSAKGKTLGPVLRALKRWGEQNT